MNSTKTTLILLILLVFVVALSRGTIQKTIERVKVGVSRKDTALSRFVGAVKAGTNG